MSEMILLRDSLSIEEKAAQVLMVSIDGSKHYSAKENFHIQSIPVGSILFFKKNIGNEPTEVAMHLSSITEYNKRTYTGLSPLFVIDHEGGFVHRLKDVATHIPSAQAVASSFPEDQAQNLYYYAGKQLRSLGFHINLAPVVEISNDQSRLFLSSRAYGHDSKTVFSFASAAIRGYKRAGVAISLKHFPGNTNEDPHGKLPSIHVSKEFFYSEYVSHFLPYFQFNPESILLSNIIVTSLDEDLPFCFSYEGVTGVLRNTLKYDGVCITDDIAMESVKKAGLSPIEATLLALQAGCDIIMTTDTDVRSLVSAIAKKAKSDTFFLQRLDEAVLRILLLKTEHSIATTARQRNYFSHNSMVRIRYFDNQTYDTYLQETKKILEDLDDAANRR